MLTSIVRRLPSTVTAFAATPLAWHATLDLAAWRTEAGFEFVAVKGVVYVPQPGDHTATQTVINIARMDDFAAYMALDALHMLAEDQATL